MSFGWRSAAKVINSPTSLAISEYKRSGWIIRVRNRWARTGIAELTVWRSQKIATSDVVKSASEDARWRRCSPSVLLLVIKISMIWRSIFTSHEEDVTLSDGGM